MPKYNVTVERTETYTSTIEVEAESSDDAKKIIEAKLEDSWDAVFDDEGEYIECYSTVKHVAEKENYFGIQVHGLWH